ncbi:MAG: AMP-binding protein [Deltaproteobacteria bacterium]|nr:AMP-binding protein [Deltaproteobacteria bacterium]
MSWNDYPSVEEIHRQFDWEEFSRRHLDWDPGERLNIAHEVVDRHARDPQKVALFCISREGKEEKYTYRELKKLTSQFANVLRELGIKKGDAVARLLPRIPEAYITLFGTWKAGAIDVPLYTAFGPEAIEYRVQDSGAKLLITDAENRDKWVGTRESLPEVNVLVTSRDRSSGMRRGDLSFWSEMDKVSREFATVETSSEDIAILQYTSGTTGLPKGTAIPHKGIITVLPYPKYLLDVKDDDMFWGYADPAWVYGSLTVGSTLLCLGHSLLVDEGRLEAKRWYEIMERWEVTNFSAAPTSYRTILAAGEDLPKHYQLKVERFTSGGEFLNAEAMLWFERNLGVPIADQYGITEVGMLLGNYPGMKLKPGSMGKPFPGFEIKIMDEEGNEAAPNQTGLIVAKKNPYFLSTNYWKQPEKWNESFIKDQWFNTGDLAAKDEDGYFYFKGRSDDLMSISGYRVGPAEVEGSLMEHPAVSEAAVIGKPDPIRGEIIKAFIVLKSGFQPSDRLAGEIQESVKQRLSKHSFPRQIEFLSELPKTASGKIMRRELRKRL